MSLRVAMRPGPGYVQCPVFAKFIKAVSAVPAHAAKRVSPSARRAGNCASGSRPLSAKRAVGNCAAGNVHRLAAIRKPSKPSEPISPGLALLGHHHNGWAPKSSIRRSGRGLQGRFRGYAAVFIFACVFLAAQWFCGIVCSLS